MNIRHHFVTKSVGGNLTGKLLRRSDQNTGFAVFGSCSIPPCESDADVLKAEIAAHSKVSPTYVHHKIFQGSKSMSSIASYGTPLQ
jgi:hypothetical protein